MVSMRCSVSCGFLNLLLLMSVCVVLVCWLVLFCFVGLCCCVLLLLGFHVFFAWVMVSMLCFVYLWCSVSLFVVIVFGCVVLVLGLLICIVVLIS